MIQLAIPFQGNILGMPFRPAFGGGGAAAANWWEAGGATGIIAAYKPKGAASLADSYVNLANPGTYDCYLGDAPTLSSGWVFNGTTQYLKTGITPANGWSVLIQLTAATPAGGLPSPFGCTDTSGYGMTLQCDTTGTWFINQNYVFATGTVVGAGNYAMGGQKGYVNGSDVGVNIPTVATTWAEVFIGANNFNGTPVRMPCTVTAFAIYNTALNATQIAAVAAAMAAL